MTIDPRAVLVVIIGLATTGTALAVTTEHPAPYSPRGMGAAVTAVADDSMRVTVQWSAPPRAQWYRVRATDVAGNWERTAETTGTSTALWVPLTEEETPARVCVSAWNRHPVRGDQEGGTNCAEWTIPAGLAPPGAPDSIRVIPDTVGGVALRWRGLPSDLVLQLGALGEHEVGMALVGQATRGQTLACVQAPDGRTGWVMAEVRDGWHLYAAPWTGLLEEPGCIGTTTMGGTDPGAVELEEREWVYELPVWPTDMPVLVFADPTRIHARRETTR